MYTKELTQNKKAKYYPLLVERDGPNCFYCGKPFVESIPGLQMNFDHLNNDEHDNRVENLCLCHAECNQKKKWDFDMQFIAHEKLKQNVASGSVRESGRGRENNPDASTDGDELTDGQINEIINKLVKSTLEEYLPEGSDKTISYPQMLSGICYLVIQQTKGRGSEQAVRRSLNTHCSMFAPWESFKEGRGNSAIRRRKKD